MNMLVVLKMLELQVAKAGKCQSVEELVHLMGKLSDVLVTIQKECTYIYFVWCIENYLKAKHGLVSDHLGLRTNKGVYAYSGYFVPFNSEVVTQIVTAYETTNKKIADAVKELQ
jgi:hypothetical protein